ncbi:ABC transporter ATP-binding protein [Paenibacillus sp. FSL R10-2734]|uniref:ABC transporter ATP-binding protein n=1 Tax=Paenibacillus sp. FSL R10-2734 TaxID=2954691 RepID=UPI0030DAC033
MLIKEVCRIENISKRYGGTQVIQNLSFSIAAGEIVGLVGPNGAGKTTLMRIIVGLTRQFEGDVLIQGKNIQTTSSATRHIGCVIEEPGFYPYMTGYRNLRFFADITGTVSEVVLHEVVSLMGLDKAINKKVKHYSMGMKQRLGIALALLQKPEFLVLDEPTNGLDPEGIYEIREYLHKLAKEWDISILISSHLLDEIEKLCDRAEIIQKGQLLQTIHLQEEKMAGREILYTMETGEPDRLAVFLKDRKFVVLEVRIDRVVLKLDKERITGIIQEIGKHDIQLTAFYEVSQTLEQQFLSLVEENHIE